MNAAVVTTPCRIPAQIVSVKAVDEELAALEGPLKYGNRGRREWARARADLLLDRRLELEAKGLK